MKPILVVDDEADIREALVEILEREHYSVHSARNGLEALEKLKSLEELPQLIILDGQMPLMDGNTFYKILSQDPKYNCIPVLAVSGNIGGLANLPSHCRFFRKPFTVPELLRTVAELFELQTNNELLRAN